MHIRRATQSDFKSITAIHIENWKDTYSDIFPSVYLSEKLDKDLTQHWNNIKLQAEDILLVAEEKTLIGFIAVWCRPDPLIDNLHISPSFRSREAGTRLLKKAAINLIDKGYKRAHLWVFESNDKAIRFYKKMGGVQTDREIKDIFGYQVPCLKFKWDNLTLICEILNK